jgi:peptidoglycan/xylan/chitin deacetylase (PgdA/CDA1 family)
MTRPPVLARLVYAARWGIAQALYWTGALHVWKRMALRGRAVVLTYHRVLDDDGLAATWSHPAIVVREATFARHMRLLKRHFDVMTLDRFAERLDQGATFPRPACLVTFDDGWIDTFATAGPILEREVVPAVVFLPTEFIGGTRTFWQERLGALLHATWDAARRDAALAAAVAPVLERHGLAGLLAVPADAVRSRVRDLVQARKAEDSRTGGSPIAELEAALGSRAPGLGADAFMTWDQARNMAARGVVFGGHGVTHRFLTTLTPEELEHEVGGAKAVLDRELGRSDAFCYPNGNWNPAVAEAVERHRYRLAFSTRRGHVGPGENRYAIRRLNVHEDMSASPALFLARVVGAL